MKNQLKSFLVALLIAQPLAAQDTLRLIFSGDIMGHEAQILSAKTSRHKFDYKPCFEKISPVLERADMAIGNLEVTLPGSRPYTGFMLLPIFRSPDALAVALKNTGFDFLMTANNHSNDSRRRGIYHTIEVLRRLGFLQTGTFENAAKRAENYPLMVEKKGIKLAFLNYTFVGTNGIPTQRPSIVNKLDTVQIKMDIIKALSYKPDFIIAVVHWGIEHSLETSDAQRWQAEFLTKNGVNLIIGMHPHVVQPIDSLEVNSSDGIRHRALVAYSLGNFISNHQMPNADGGILFRIDLVREPGIKTVRIGRFGYLPIWRMISKNMLGNRVYQVLPISEIENEPALYPELDEANRLKMLAYAASVRQRLTCPEWVELTIP